MREELKFTIYEDGLRKLVRFHHKRVDDHPPTVLARVAGKNPPPLHAGFIANFTAGLAASLGAQILWHLLAVLL